MISGKVQFESQNDEEKTLASYVLFKDLYDNKKDIYDILIEFIIFTLKRTSTVSFSIIECLDSVKKEFGLNDIPTATLKTALKRLKREGYIHVNNGRYLVANPLFANEEHQITPNKLLEILSMHKKLLERLFQFIEKQSLTVLSEDDKMEIRECFNSYFMDGREQNDYSKFIYSFIVAQTDPTTKSFLSNLKESSIIYNGVTFSPDAMTIPAWQKDLYIYLDMEILFNAASLNGVFYLQLFREMYELIQEINKKRHSIKLRFFSETKTRINHFFETAENIIRKRRMPLESSDAMCEILNGCETPSDIMQKRITFWDKINALGIQEFDTDFYATEQHKYNLIGKEIYTTLKNRLEELHSPLSGESQDELINFLNYIHILRKGNSKKSFEEISHIFLTGKDVLAKLAWHPSIKKPGEFPFVTDMEFITNKLWVKRSRGFASQKKPSLSLEFATKAKIALSSMQKSSLQHKLDEAKIKYRNGELSKEDMIQIYINCRTCYKSPNEVNNETIEDVLDDIREEDLQNFIAKTQKKEELANIEKDKKIKSLEEKVLYFEGKDRKRKKFRSSCAKWTVFIVIFTLSIYLFYIDYNYIASILALSNFGCVVYRKFFGKKFF